MTFILAIQLEDSLIVAADKRSIIISSDHTLEHRNDHTCKLQFWEHGVITGTGEYFVLHNAIELFLKKAQSKIESLPQCLKISRMLRELEVEHSQIQISKLLYSHHHPNSVQLYSIYPDPSGNYQVEACQPNEIVLWLYHSDIKAITPDLQQLYAQLRPRHSFNNQGEWFDYYINDFCKIYQTQAKYDSTMSASFDYFFQSKDDYLYGHIPNTHHHRLTFQELITT